ncbi:uncharacterized protein LOC134275255 [Saccostrea cucullata]|uniref:uncharacterized protein LOC134275255 n=1 Tax=Saccostrea cuccullata TaxID=36930 RepID=UPI002ED3EE32
MTTDAVVNITEKRTASITMINTVPSKTTNKIATGNLSDSDAYFYIITPLAVIFAFLALIFFIIACKNKRRRFENYFDVRGRTAQSEYETVSDSSTNTSNSPEDGYDYILDVIRNPG